MTTFDILQPNLNLHTRCFVEASAGCGKTFSIENIVTRLVMDEDRPIDIDKILVLTFTKEATSQLKTRIRQNLEFVKNQLEKSDEQGFEYVRAYFQKDVEKKERATSNLQEALNRFDLAQIFTIHKFCFMKLKQFVFEAKIGLSEDFEKSSLSPKAYASIVRDYLGFGLDTQILGKPQIKLLLTYYKNDLDALVQRIVLQLTKEIRIYKCKNWSEICIECEREVNQIQLEDRKEGEEIIHLYENAAHLFKGGVNRNKEVPKILKSALVQLSLFLCGGHLDEFIDSYATFKKVFDNENLKKSATKALDKYSTFIAFHEKLCQRLFPLLESAIRKENLVALICYESQKFLESFFENNKILTPNNILTKFHDLIKKKEIAKQIRSHYDAVIVDEFQDTDSLQWHILSNLFINDLGKQIPFYLVGDPKQSIYGFRRADIYTYLKAAQMLQVKSISTLNVNYRSQPGLIEALNALFTKEQNKWLFLPKLNSSLAYREVQSFAGIQKRNFNDKKGSLHFILAEQKEKIGLIPSKELEERFLFPFFINEILKFHHDEKMPFHSFAILVRDRFQGARLKNFLKKHHLPFVSTRPESLQGLSVVESFLQIYLAVLHQNKSHYICALKLNSILQLSIEACEANLFTVLDTFTSLRSLLFEEGFLAFYHALMGEALFSEKSIDERLLSEEGGLYLYLELEQMKDLLVQEEIAGANPYDLLRILEDLCQATALPEKAYPLRQNFEEDALQILTLHMSKGLEFEVVFALGLINQIKAREDFIFDSENNVLKPFSSMSQESLLEFHREQDAEKMRQLYVAMTRAKQRLYVPYVISSREFNFLQSSPLESFLKHLNLSDEALLQFIAEQKEMSYTLCDQEVQVSDYRKLSSVPLVKPSLLKRTFQQENKHSFTSLASPHLATITDLKAPSDFSHPDKTIHTLPAGSNTGILFHKILEDINFEKNDLKINEPIMEARYAPWKEVIEVTLLKLLKTPIKTPSAIFTLNNLKTNQVLKEIEFLYPLKGNEEIKEMTAIGDYLQGYIDLVCFYGEKYYLIDYKTNWLGGCDGDYIDLLPSMQHNQYFLQAQIYKEALRKYLSLFDSRDFKECFGGTIYWFVRGIDAQNRGQFFIEP